LDKDMFSFVVYKLHKIIDQTTPEEAEKLWRWCSDSFRTHCAWPPRSLLSHPGKTAFVFITETISFL